MDSSEIESVQLSFDVGGASPDFASLKITGGLLAQEQLRKGTDVHVRVATMDGELIAEGAGYVSAIAFKDKRNKHGVVESTERAHTIKVE